MTKQLVFYVERRKPDGGNLEHAPCDTLEEAIQWLRFNFQDNPPAETSVKITVAAPQ